MTRIVYGVSGEGSGHSSRAREVLRHLLEQGHEVRVVSYDRGYRNLREDFDVFEVEGLSIATVDNRVSVVRTFTENLARLSDGVRRLRELRREVFKGFRPEVAITDFEPMTGYLARHYGLPLVSLDNQHRMRYMAYPRPPELAREARTTETVVRLMVPSPDVALVTTFWIGAVSNERTFLFPPILRREVRAREAREGEHVLVYATKAFDALPAVLRELQGERFLVYGFDRTGRDGPLEYRPFDPEVFLDDLAGARAVIATAGFTLITEALYLRKPILALPMAGQFEQELNALLLEATGCGRRAGAVERATIEGFLAGLEAFRAPLAAYDAGDPAALNAKLEELLADGGVGARLHRERRRRARGRGPSRSG